MRLVKLEELLESHGKSLVGFRISLATSGKLQKDLEVSSVDLGRGLVEVSYWSTSLQKYNTRVLAKDERVFIK